MFLLGTMDSNTNIVVKAYAVRK